MYAPFVVFVFGLLIGFASFVYAAVNVYRGVTSDEKKYSLNSLIKGHLGAMIGMALGGLVSTIGMAWGLFDLLLKL